jgi:hypothetical protein
MTKWLLSALPLLLCPAAVQAQGLPAQKYLTLEVAA